MRSQVVKLSEVRSALSILNRKEEVTVQPQLALWYTVVSALATEAGIEPGASLVQSTRTNPSSIEWLIDIASFMFKTHWQYYFFGKYALFLA